MELTCRAATIGWLAALGFVLLASPRAATAQTVATLAGVGTPGIADGRAGAATFLFPSAVAVDAHGDVYVADAAAQRVRVVRADRGIVSTLAGSGTIEPNAGWVPGGDADGPGQSAQFSEPLGIAVAPNGDVYVADAGNHSIRRIAPDGTVSTFARGLGRPHQLALDQESRLYVADSARGVVRIDPDGRSTVLPLSVVTPYGIALWEQGGTLTLFVADDRGIVMARDAAEIRIDRVDATPTSDTTEGEESIGAPYQLAALDDRTVAYTDLRDEAVRMLAFEPKLLEHGRIAGAAEGQMHRRVAGAVTLVAGSARGDAMMDGGGFADGTAASFDAPMGIAATAGGELVVADAGNRRIRIVRGIDRGQRLLEDGALPPPRDAPSAYRLLLTGPSGVWWDTTWPASIPGTIERDLASARTTAQRPFEVIPSRLLGADIGGYASYLDEVGDSRTVDAVILMLNGGVFGGEDSTRWIEPTAGALRTLRERLARAHVALLLVVLPEPLELNPAEQTWRKIVEDALVPVLPDDDARWREVVRQAGVDAVDLFEVFRAELAGGNHRPLFGSDEAHLTTYGRAVAAHAISAALARLQPWNAPRR